MKPCDKHWADAMLFYDGELVGRELVAFGQHLLECRACGTYIEELGSLSLTLRSARPLVIPSNKLCERVNAAREQMLSRSSARGRPADGRWRMLLAAVVLAAVVTAFVPFAVRQARANSYIRTALTTHRLYLSGSVPLEIHSDSPAEVTTWFAGKLPFRFQLPSSQDTHNSVPAYHLVGARLVNFEGHYAGLVSYQFRGHPISLLVVSNEWTTASGGEVVRASGLDFHYRSEPDLKLITWTNNRLGLTYALVSSLSGSAKQSCLVCHQNMSDRDSFAPRP
jgi:anti-sigma factor RsiW